MSQDAQQGVDLEQIKSDVAEKANEMIGQAVEFAREKPHMAVGAALAIGWVLGNGIPPRMLMGAARIGWKAMLGGALAGGGLMSMLTGQDDESASETPRASGGAVRSGQPAAHRRESHARSRNSGSTGSSGSGGGSAVKE